MDSHYVDKYCFCALLARLKEDLNKSWELFDEDSNFFSAMCLVVQGHNGKVLARAYSAICQRQKIDLKSIILCRFHKHQEIN